METIFKVCKKGDCGIQVQGLELENGNYSEPGAFPAPRDYSYGNSITINVLRSVDSNGNYTIEDTSIVQHTGSDISNFDLPKDGLYEISHIIIPTYAYVDSIPSADKLYSELYYWDGQNIILDGSKVSIDNFMDASEVALNIETNRTSIVRGDKRTFCMCNLNNCFYNLCKNLLSSYCGKCLNKLNAPQQEIFNRDLIWMSMNVISYLIEDNKLVEAQRILESLQGCGNICKNESSKNSSNCGCN